MPFLLTALLVTWFQAAPQSTQQPANKPAAEIEFAEPVFGLKLDEPSRPKILYREKAQYTKEAYDLGICGVVILSFTLTEEGRPADIKVIKGLPYGLTESAIKSTEKILSRPAYKDGKPTSFNLTAEYTFEIAQLSAKTATKILLDHFPLISEETAKRIANFAVGRLLNSRQLRDFTAQCAGQGTTFFDQSESKEYELLMGETMAGLPASDLQALDKIVARSKDKKLSTADQIEFTEYLRKAVNNLDPAKRERLKALYNKAVTLNLQTITRSRK
jgi:TonB family protein